MVLDNRRDHDVVRLEAEPVREVVDRLGGVAADDRDVGPALGAAREAKNRLARVLVRVGRPAATCSPRPGARSNTTAGTRSRAPRPPAARRWKPRRRDRGTGARRSSTHGTCTSSPTSAIGSVVSVMSPSSRPPPSRPPGGSRPPGEPHDPPNGAVRPGTERFPRCWIEGDGPTERGDDHMQHIEVFADVVCPFTHVGLRRLRGARPEGNGTKFLVRAWPLEWVNGTPLAAELVGREIDAFARLGRSRPVRWFRSEGLSAHVDPGVRARGRRLPRRRRHGRGCELRARATRSSSTARTSPTPRC